LKKFFSNVVLYVLIGIFILGLLLFYVGLGISGNDTDAPNFNRIFIIIGLIILFPYLIYFIKIFYFDKKKYNRKAQNNILKLKINGVVLPVNLETLKINKTRKSYYSKVIHNTARSGALNQMTGNPDDNIQTTECNRNEVKFNIPYGTNFIKFTRTIDMEPTTLLLRFAVKKETFLYVNPVNMNDYYLDLEFLNQ
jgi:uncharacterized membrane protein (GlpM family)